MLEPDASLTGFPKPRDPRANPFGLELTQPQQEFTWEIAELLYERHGKSDDLWDAVDQGDKRGLACLQSAGRAVPAANRFALRVLDGTTPKPPNLKIDWRLWLSATLALSAFAGLGHLAWLEAYSVRDWLDTPAAAAKAEGGCPANYDIAAARKAGFSDSALADWLASGCPGNGPPWPGEVATP